METEHDRRYMQLALRQAELALQNRWIPVGSVFVKDDRIIAYGVKSGIGHTHFDHAEHNGCYQTLWNREGPKNLSGFTVYSTLEPCIVCMSLLMHLRVSRIVYGMPDPYGGGRSLLENPGALPPRFKKERPEVRGGFLQESSRVLLRRFFEEQEEGGHWGDPENPLVKLSLSNEPLPPIDE